MDAHTKAPAATFTPAVRSKVFLRMALSGPSGSGKTYTSLIYARAIAGMDGCIALADSEKRRASYYADVDFLRGDDGVVFCNSDINPPYKVEKFVAAIKGAEAAGFNVLVIDGISQEWSGATGSLMDVKADLDSRPGANFWANFRLPSKDHNAFIAAMNECNMHLIVTMRSKEAHAEQEEDGKKRIVKLGMAPIQRPGMGYEFALWLEMAMDHSAQVQKDITQVYVEKPTGVFKPDMDEALKLAAWLKGGIDPEQVERSSIEVADEPQSETLPGFEDEKPQGNGLVTPETNKAMWAACNEAKLIPSAEIRKRGWKWPPTEEQAQELIAGLKTKK